VGAYTWRGVEGGAQDPGLGRRIGGGAQRSVGGWGGGGDCKSKWETENGGRGVTSGPTLPLFVLSCTKRVSFVGRDHIHSWFGGGRVPMNTTRFANWLVGHLFDTSPFCTFFFVFP
jgi:hypothetical protein